MRISVIISNYNAAQFLPDALNSVLGQDLAPAEVFVADDGSTDDSFARFQPFRTQAHWIANPHGGQAAALDRALMHCTGDWVAFLESDDVWEPVKLSEVARAVASDPFVAAVQHDMQQVDADLSPLPSSFAASDARWTLDDFLAGRALLGGMSALTARVEALRSVGRLPADLVTCVDEFLQPRLLAAGAVRHLALPLGKRRVHGGNFYAEARQDAGKLERYLKLRGALDAHLESFLWSRQLKLTPEHELTRRRERAQWDLFLHRLRREWRPAFADWKRAVAASGSGGYAVFKGAALAAALVSPRLYSFLYCSYGRLSILPRLRRRLLK